MKALRLLFVQETNWLERNVVHQHHLAERLVLRGHKVTVIDYDTLWPGKRPHPLWKSREVFTGIQRISDSASLSVIRPGTVYLPLLCHLTWTTGSLLELKRIISSERVDAVIGLTLTNSYPMALLLKSKGIAYISMVLEPYHSLVQVLGLKNVAKLAERMALRSADRVVVFTPQMVQYARRMGARPDQIALLKTGVSLDVFKPGLNGSARRAELGIEPNEKVLFFMGWLYNFSGLREIVHAIHENPFLLANARLIIVGVGDIFQELRSFSNQKGLENRIILLGQRPYRDIPSLISTADVCLLPFLENDTTREIVPMKVYEYMAAGKPVVATRLPGLVAEFGEDHGVLYANHPAEVLTKAIDLMNQPIDLRRLGRIARYYAESNADWDRTTQSFENLLISILFSRQEEVNFIEHI